MNDVLGITFRPCLRGLNFRKAWGKIEAYRPNPLFRQPAKYPLQDIGTPARAAAQRVFPSARVWRPCTPHGRFLGALKSVPALGRPARLPVAAASFVPEHHTADIAQEKFFERITQTPDRGGQGQPFNGDNVLHYVATRIVLGLHAPELHNLGTTACAIGYRTEEFTDTDPMSGFLDNFAACARARALFALELPARQNPVFVLRTLHDSNPRARPAAHHDPACRMNRLSCH